MPREGPISGKLRQEMSSVFSKFISTKAAMIKSRGLQKEVGTESLMKSFSTTVVIILILQIGLRKTLAYILCSILGSSAGSQSSA